MAFTDKEREAWHLEKRSREIQTLADHENCLPQAECVHCHQPFPITDGIITPDVAICYGCAD